MRAFMYQSRKSMTRLGCVPFSTGSNQCEGGMLVIDPTKLPAPTAVIGAFDSTTNTGVVPLNQCGPNGATVGPHEISVGLHPR